MFSGTGPRDKAVGVLGRTANGILIFLVSWPFLLDDYSLNSLIIVLSITSRLTASLVWMFCLPICGTTDYRLHSPADSLTLTRVTTSSHTAGHLHSTQAGLCQLCGFPWQWTWHSKQQGFGTAFFLYWAVCSSVMYTMSTILSSHVCYACVHSP